MKIFSLFVVIAVGLSTFAAGQISSCSQQGNCFEWSATEQPVDECKQNGVTCRCQWKMCVRFNANKFGCPLPSPRASIDETCVASETTCSPPLSSATLYNNFPNEGVQCQVVPPGGGAKFIFQDGAGCAPNYAYSVASERGAAPTPAPYATNTTCEPNYDQENSCTEGVFSPGGGCLWTYNAPESCYQYRAWACGDPHFQTWSGEKYDFHGVCDLVLLENRDFDNGLDMDIHIRTKGMNKKFSYISNAVIRIGEDTLEVAAGDDGSIGEYWINGEAGLETSDSSHSVLQRTISGYPVTYRRPSNKQAEFVVDLGGEDTVTLRTWGKFVRVGMSGTLSNFHSSRGLMGTIEGVKLARDNVTVIDDPNEFGQEWQVLASDPKLFHDAEGPQYPQKCTMPSAVDMRRRLGESTISQEEAEVACSRVNESERDICIFDVMAAGDPDVAGAY